MAEFTDVQVNGMMRMLADDGIQATRELAVLELEDVKRKGCLLERADGYCIGCSALKDGGECPMNTWEKRHPEYKDDELAMKIKILEAGGEEAYKKKLEAQALAKEKISLPTAQDKVYAAQYVLNLYYRSKISMPDGEVLNVVNTILTASTKAEIQDILAKCYDSLANQTN